MKGVFLMHLVLGMVCISLCGEIGFKGVTFVGDRYCPEVSFEDPLAMESLHNLKNTGANYVAIVVTEYQDYINSTEIYPVYKDYPKNDYYTYKTESIKGIIKVINEAHRLGMKVMLKPHVDVLKEKKYDSVWRGNIYCTKNTCQQWFDSYWNMMEKYVKLSEELGVEMISVSCELISTSSKEEYWRELIAKIRKIYRGKLVSSANHDGEEFNKKWWDVLDYIGVDAYYFSDHTARQGYLKGNFNVTVENIAKKLQVLSAKFNKDIIITEIGFCSGVCKINDRTYVPKPIDLDRQRYLYETFIKVLSEKPFIKGFFFWAWNTDPNTGGEEDHCITPQWKGAEKVLYQLYGGDITKFQSKPKGSPKCLCTI